MGCDRRRIVPAHHFLQCVTIRREEAPPMTTRTAWFNGKLVPETDVVIPFRDRSFNRGDGCFDMTRTFNGQPFRVKEHVDRLFRSLRYLRIDCGLEPKEMIAIAEDVVERN